MVSSPPLKCACESCMCMVSPVAGIDRDGRIYCCEACANAHPNGQACDRPGCNCHAS
jgi:metallothionein